MASYWLYCGDAELGKIEFVDGVVSSTENLLSGDDGFTGIYGDIADAIRDGRESVSGKTEGKYEDSRPFVLTWRQIDADAESESDEGEDEDDKPQREKYITINDDIDCWGEVPANFDMQAEIAKITNAADDAGIVVYDGCEPSQETIDSGKQVDWSTEWCYSYEWTESQWVEWFRKQ